MNERSTDAELISIIEGPSPEFRQPMETWAMSIHEDQQIKPVVYCQMRTLNGPGMVKRCQTAWNQDRPVKLDFPDEMGLRQQVDIVAVRWSVTGEGHLLHLWVHSPKDLDLGDDHDLTIL